MKKVLLIIALLTAALASQASATQYVAKLYDRGGAYVATLKGSTALTSNSIDTILVDVSNAKIWTTLDAASATSLEDGFSYSVANLMSTAAADSLHFGLDVGVGAGQQVAGQIPSSVAYVNIMAWTQELNIALAGGKVNPQTLVENDCLTIGEWLRFRVKNVSGGTLTGKTVKLQLIIPKLFSGTDR